MKNAASGRTKTDLPALYDELEGKLRSLESLGRTQEKYGDFLTQLVDRDGEIRTVQFKTQRGTVIHPVQRIFPLKVQAIANSDKELKEESISVNEPENVSNTNDVIVKKYTSSGRLVKEPQRLDLLNYNCYRFETLPKSQRGGVCCE
ncbi:uncharacterized protein TNIN_492942 [Trichonephila inaurata madagascariensis]|uniref:Uncharacterized protein n=1 Tax=Trichonephila inaurata madagascariensis TaxID=2747483 RepID=A0A8X7CJF3_9ARAC|nr:uncharacterized protein TNIN_492942 [Trichonephila inaurata madagascariensis]